jgi:MFS family permease
VLAARDVQFVVMGNRRRTRKSLAAGRAGLGRDFWLYFGGQAVSQLGGSFTTFALPLLMFKLTHSATSLALTTVAEFVPYLLFGLLLGAVVDRFDRKRLMLASDIAQALVIAVIPVLATGGLLRPADIYAVAFVQSTLGIIFDCGEFAAIPSLVGQRELVPANARVMAANNAGQILGPALAGALVAFVPVAGLLLADAGSFLVSSVCLALIRCSFNAGAPARRPAGPVIQALVADVREGLAYVWSNPVLRSISIMMALINLVASTADSQLVLFARRALHATSSEIGFLYAAGAAGIVAVSLVAGPIRRRASFAVTALGALVVAGLTTTAMALAGSYPAALVLWAASSGFGMLLNINTVALRQAIVPPPLYGRVVSVAQVLAWSAIPLGSLAGAAAINLSGSVTGVYAVVGGLTAAIALAFAFSPVAHGDRYLAEAARRRAGPAGAGPSPGPGGTGCEDTGHGPGSPGAGPAGESAGAGQGAGASK